VCPKFSPDTAHTTNIESTFFGRTKVIPIEANKLRDHTPWENRINTHVIPAGGTYVRAPQSFCGDDWFGMPIYLVVERLLGRELPWLVTMWFALRSGNIMLTPQAYESWGMEREGTIVCEYVSHLSNVMTPCMFVVNLSINNVDYIDSGSFNLISVSNHLIKSPMGCMLFMDFTLDE
jgi:hypothetical protein